MRKSQGQDLIEAKSYIAFIIRRIRSGGLWSTVMSVYKNIRRITLISAIIRTMTVVITLIERSAWLLLFFSSLVIFFPALICATLILSVACISKYAKNHRRVRSWLSGARKLTVYITDSPTAGRPLFVRMAYEEAEKDDNPVIVLCKGYFVSFCWCSENLLKVKADYFFFLKAFYFRKLTANIIYIALG